MKEACVKHTWIKAFQAPGVYPVLPKSLSHDPHSDGIVSHLVGVDPLGVRMRPLGLAILVHGQAAAVQPHFDVFPCPRYRAIMQLLLAMWVYFRHHGHNALCVPITIGRNDSIMRLVLGHNVEDSSPLKQRD